MRIEIDTGSRLDQSGDTTFAFSNDVEKAVLLRQRVRDECLEQLSGERIRREIRLFAACVYLLLREHLGELREIVLDREYPGHDNVVRWILLNLIKKHSAKAPQGLQIRFSNIGKQSAAHEVAYRTYRKEREPTKALTSEEILSVLLS